MQPEDGPSRTPASAAVSSPAAEHEINRRIFETSLDLILVVSRGGDFIRVSPSSQAILGYMPDEMVGRSAVDFVYPDDLEPTREEMRLARRGQQMRNFECRYHHKDERVVPLVWTGVWSEPEQQHFFIGRDMTDRLAAEERERRSQRLEAIGQLTGGIAHDFNNLLSIIVGNLDQLTEEVSGNAKALEFTEAAVRASLRGAELTRQLLAFARRQPLDAKVIDLNERLLETMGLLQRTLGGEVAIKTVTDPGLWPAFADSTQFESALANLAINARDAMPDGGRLTFETGNAHLDDDYARENLEVVPGDYAMLAVSDTGCGMAPEVAARVFEPFFTTKQPGKGTGLGLSMVYGFAKQSQGHVKIYSELGHGTSVRLYLPRARAGAKPAVESVPLTTTAEGRGERILVVEDNNDVRLIVAGQIRGLGYEVVEAAGGDEALRILDADDGIDLLFTDVVMPGGITGDLLAREAKDRHPDIKVVLTSGFPTASMQNGPRSEFFQHLLSKPYRKPDLAAKLRAVLDADR